MTWLQVIGEIAATGLAATALLLPSPRARWAVLAGALAVATALVVGEAWNGPLAELRTHELRLAGLSLAGAVVIGVLTFAFLRWSWALPLAALATLPIRIPFDVGGGSSNLLVPLYAVIASGVIAALIRSLGEPRRRPLAIPALLAIPLAAALVLYGVQSAYSSDVAFAARNVGFFLVPFAALFVLLVESEWSRRLLIWALAVVAGEAVLFAALGILQHQVESIFWNPALESSNDFHFYFRANSLFWDPNIYGRYLALALTLLLAALMWIEDRGQAIWLAVVIAVVWTGLLFGFSQTSFIALLAGVLVLSALRFSFHWTLIATPFVIVAAAAAVVLGGSTAGSRGAVASETSGHSTLISGGLRLAEHRPLYGYGSGSFPVAFREHELTGVEQRRARTTVSHNEPVTVAAEQGATGLVVYIALLGAALWTLFGGIGAIAPGLDDGPAGDRDRPSGGGRPSPVEVARIAVAAAFCVLLVHTIGYAGYLTDPITWSLIAIGAALAAPAARGGSDPPAPVAVAASVEN